MKDNLDIKQKTCYYRLIGKLREIVLSMDVCLDVGVLNVRGNGGGVIVGFLRELFLVGCGWVIPGGMGCLAG